MPGTFPDDFLWGAAASAYQIEGAVAEDGRGESIWDRFCRRPGAIERGETGDVACDHYHRCAEDVDLMARLGLRAYRFSIAWPRIQPEGRGRPNARGLDFYGRLVDRLLAKDITPLATLYHWDLPQALQDRGGWLERATAERFRDYAAICFEALGDRIPLWATHNEPAVAAFLGHLVGVHAPGIRDPRAAVRAAHHLLLSHGLAVEAFRDLAVPAQVGIVLDFLPPSPATESEPDLRAVELADDFANRWFLDPVRHGRYPPKGLAQVESAIGPADWIETGDLETISRPIDFLGVNYYRGERVAADPGPLGWTIVPPEPGPDVTEMRWKVMPDTLRELLLRLAREHPDLPLYVTENGAAFPDEPDEHGRVEDPARVDYLRRHIEAAGAAMAEGVDLRGYFYWSILDNFEWGHGYRPRFGLVRVEFATQERIPKASAAAYSRIIEAGGP